MTLIAAAIALNLTAQDPKYKIDDYSSSFGKLAMDSIKESTDPQKRAAELKPVVTGYFYWRMQTLGKLPSSKLEKLHMSICAALLDFYYPGTAQAWKPHFEKIENSSSLELPEETSNWLNKELRSKVFDPYWSINSMMKPTATEKEIGEFSIGVSLGDLSGNMMLQYMSGGMEIPREWMAGSLESLATNLAEYPKAFSPAIRTKLAALAKLRKGKIVEPADFPALEKAHKEALDAIAKGT